MIVREYSENDWSRLCEIHDLARLDELRGASLEDAFIPLEIAAKNEDLFDYRLLVAEDNDQVVGFIAHDDEEIAWLYVDPTAYRRGVGKALVNAVIGSPARTFSIEVLKGNNTALNFYQSIGFIETGIASGRMPGNEKFHVTVHTLDNAKAT
ncbi:GNAT family N-acetyltransferase [Grimontia kaedaensis]|uniref:GNAT family N-acetyltransferase n=1 Tax=Grimontia kaedaensis TaxID=2872157 RepID=A0ABY4X115_9GAMM|nr:GNAT family N-acetyltransferase [Grimontia kaedaensis]USH04938.1 GNAT family N-acetyltransferase [Grimontia kaedaensis]